MTGSGDCDLQRPNGACRLRGTKRQGGVAVSSAGHFAGEQGPDVFAGDLQVALFSRDHGRGAFPPEFVDVYFGAGIAEVRGKTSYRNAVYSLPI